MKTLKVVLFGLALSLSLQSGHLLAAYEYNTVPGDDAQYRQCKSYSMTRWEGGGELSPISGQSKAEAFCTCLWNETPEDFRGDLAKFSETDAGRALDKVCSKYSNWGD
ncbi:MAG: hypothetical protein HQL90_04490 [Magnetococcales bacterium]|nr:hypothetical protein [Magnetococcales bacterium]